MDAHRHNPQASTGSEAPVVSTAQEDATVCRQVDLRADLRAVHDLCQGNADRADAAELAIQQAHNALTAAGVPQNEDGGEARDGAAGLTLAERIRWLAGTAQAGAVMATALRLGGEELDQAASALAEAGKEQEGENAAQRAMECRAALRQAPRDEAFAAMRTALQEVVGFWDKTNQIEFDELRQVVCAALLQAGGEPDWRKKYQAPVAAPPPSPEHTPAPWFCTSSGSIMGPDCRGPTGMTSRPIAVVIPTDPCAHANGQVVAAAPEMLAVLREFLGDCENMDLEQEWPDLQVTLAKADQVVAKASGVAGAEIPDAGEGP